MRLFVAVDLDDAARRAIADEQRRLTSRLDPGRSSVKWIDPGRLHVTLLFLGEVADADAARTVELMAPDIDAAPFEVVFEHVGVFPARGAPRALWLGVTEGARELADLEKRVRERLRPLRIPVEERPFNPHLTLARWRNARPSDRVRALATEQRGVVARVHADHVTLYQSRLSSAGPTYTTLARVTLRSCLPL